LDDELISPSDRLEECPQGDGAMESCERYQRAMLEYLYDAMEDEDSAALREHLAVCPLCQTSLGEAEQERKLLASALRISVAQVRFEPPLNGVVHPHKPKLLATPARPSRRRRLPWAVAASLLLVLSVVAVFAISEWSRTDHGGPSLLTGTTIGHSKPLPNLPEPEVQVMEPAGAPAVRSPDRIEKWGQAVDGLMSAIAPDANEETIELGKPIRIHYRVTNVSPAPLGYWHVGFWPNHQIIVLDESGREVPLKPQGRSRRAAFHPGAARDGFRPVMLLSGTDANDFPVFDLTRLFVLDRPGTYTVQYAYEERQPEGWAGELRSNVLRIHIMK